MSEFANTLHVVSRTSEQKLLLSIVFCCMESASHGKSVLHSRIKNIITELPEVLFLQNNRFCDLFQNILCHFVEKYLITLKIQSKYQRKRKTLRWKASLFGRRCLLLGASFATSFFSANSPFVELQLLGF